MWAEEISQNVEKKRKEKKRRQNRNQLSGPNSQVIEVPEKDNREKRKEKNHQLKHLRKFPQI